jgi:guanylate kinase
MDKIAVTVEELQRLWDKGELLVVNELYGIKYGTPRHAITSALTAGAFPILDWPISKLDVMEQAFPGKLLRIYLIPPDADSLKQRLIDRPGFSERYEAGLAEISALQRNEFNNCVDLMLVADTGQEERLAQRIYDFYLRATG